MIAQQPLNDSKPAGPMPGGDTVRVAIKPKESDVASALYHQFHAAGNASPPEPGSAGSASMLPWFASVSDVGVGPRRPSRPGQRSGSSCGAAANLPEIGDERFGFRIRHHLGTGAFAQVYLAEQVGLAGRPVVLKFTDLDGDEPQLLAQLQHTHIVPIYSLHEDQRAGLRALCMPYFGGATLSSVLGQVWAGEQAPSSGAAIVSALESLREPHLDELPTDGSAYLKGEQTTASTDTHAAQAAQAASERALLETLREMSYSRAVVFLACRLAEALAHAHVRGVLHRDIKPSNVLLADDGRPMLLDFNLSKSYFTQRAQTEAVLGGTVAYMSPEHLRGMAACDPELIDAVDQRADIYSLGLVLFEMLTGHGPFQHLASYAPLAAIVEAMAVERSETSPSLRQHRPDLPWSLESILRKCLAPNPADRYARAEHLAEDLQRFLEDRPLQHAPELSVGERMQKWARRHPRLTAVGLVAMAASVLLGVMGLVIGSLSAGWADTRESLELSQAQDRRREFEQRTVQALCLVNTTVDLLDQTPSGVQACEEALSLYEVLDRWDWQDQPAWQRLQPDERARLARDVHELLLSLAWARTQAANNSRASVKDALGLLHRVLPIQPEQTSKALWLDRARYLGLLGEEAGAEASSQQAARLQPQDARDFFVVATRLARRQQYDEAIRELNRGLEMQPRHAWSLVQRGICRLELGQYALAIEDFAMCTGLAPELAWGWFNLGSALEKAGHRPEAIEKYSIALNRDPNFLPAEIARGLLRLELEQNREALADLNRLQERGLDDAWIHLGRGMALERLERHEDADQAFASALARAERTSGSLRQRLHWTYGFAVYKRLPERAAEHFAAVLREDPQQPQALYGQGMLLVEKHDLQSAVARFSLALKSQPGFAEARRARAVLLARLGQFAYAEKEIKDCLDRESWVNGDTLYAAACVAALQVNGDETSRVAEARSQALGFLRMALDRGFRPARATHDPDLRALRGLPEFQSLLATHD
jgi:serine/threonine protein kinase/Flp pilus assembly protein TadD